MKLTKSGYSENVIATTDFSSFSLDLNVAFKYLPLYIQLRIALIPINKLNGTRDSRDSQVKYKFNFFNRHCPRRCRRACLISLITMYSAVYRANLLHLL